MDRIVGYVAVIRSIFINTYHPSPLEAHFRVNFAIFLLHSRTPHNTLSSESSSSFSITCDISKTKCHQLVASQCSYASTALDICFMAHLDALVHNMWRRLFKLLSGMKNLQTPRRLICGTKCMDISYASLMATSSFNIPRLPPDDSTRDCTHAAHSPGVAAGAGHDTAHQNSTALRGKNTPSPPRAAGTDPKP